MRRRYGEYIGTYSPDKMSILSSSFDRTINSANLVLAAMFPPNGEQVWNKKLLWQPIAVHSIPEAIDCYIDAQSACARYVKARDEYFKSAKIIALIKQNQNLFDYLEENAGQPIRTLTNAKDVYESLDIESRTNKT